MRNRLKTAHQSDEKAVFSVLTAKIDNGYQKRKRTQWRGCFGKAKKDKNN
jgi:hypothetical protein